MEEKERAKKYRSEEGDYSGTSCGKHYKRMKISSSLPELTDFMGFGFPDIHQKCTRPEIRIRRK